MYILTRYARLRVTHLLALCYDCVESGGLIYGGNSQALTQLLTFDPSYFVALLAIRAVVDPMLKIPCSC